MPGQLPQVYNNPPASVEGDELATLRWLLARLNSRSRRHPDLSGVSESEAEVSHAALILLELARAYARGVLAICRTANAEAAYPVARSLVETWAEFRYLMQPGNRLERVHRMLVSAALAMRDEISNDESLSELREKHPTAFAEVESIRKKNRMAHYSGKSRKRLIAEMCGDGPGKSYAPLSWESHPIIQVYMNELQYHHRAGARGAGTDIGRIGVREVQGWMTAPSGGASRV